MLKGCLLDLYRIVDQDDISLDKRCVRFFGIEHLAVPDLFHYTEHVHRRVRLDVFQVGDLLGVRLRRRNVLGEWKRQGR